MEEEEKMKYTAFTSKRFFGIELEVGNEISRKEISSVIKAKSPDREVVVTDWGQTEDSNNYWHVKQDSSCGVNAHKNPDGKDYAWEIASYKASGHENIDHIASVAAELESFGVKVNDNCGFHIHAEAKDFTEEQAAIMLARWIKIEPFMCCLVPLRRIDNKHCKLWYKSKKFKAAERYDASDFWEKVAPNNYGVHENPQKRVSLNLVNYCTAVHNETDTRKTFELRLPEGTLDRKSIMNWIKLYIMFLDVSKKSEMPEDITSVTDVNEFMQYLGLETKDDYTLLSKGLYATKLWILNKMSNNLAPNQDTDKAKRVFIDITNKIKNMKLNSYDIMAA